MGTGGWGMRFSSLVVLLGREREGDAFFSVCRFLMTGRRGGEVLREARFEPFLAF